MRRTMRNAALSTAFLLCAAVAAPKITQAAPRRIVVIVAEGLNPQLVEFGSAYVKTAYGDEASVAFDDVKAGAKTQTAAGDSIAALKGILQSAAASGYKTGLVSSGDVTTVASTLYDLPAGADVARSLVSDTKFDFLAGGGRGHFIPQGMLGSLRTDALDLGKALTDAGGTTVFDIEAMDGENKGKTLVLQSDSALSYSLDRDIEKEAGFAEMVTMALQTLSADNAPFMLVIHDSLLAQSLAARDTPAVLEQFRGLDGIVADVLGMREENPDSFGVAILANGAATAPRFTTELPNDRSNAFYMVSAMPMSYGKAGSALAQADDAKLTAFGTEQYKGWKSSPENRAAVLAGTMTPEAALRAAYEPALKISYEPVAATPTLYTIGLDLAGDLAQTLNALAVTQPAPVVAAP